MVINQFFRSMTFESNIDWTSYPVHVDWFVNLLPEVSEVIQDLNLKTLNLPVYIGPVFTSDKTALLFTMLSGGESYIHFSLPGSSSDRDHFSENLYVKLEDIVSILEKEAEAKAASEAQIAEFEDSKKKFWLKNWFSKTL
ncbi:MAG: hypothetical protein JXR30_00405 [Alphaproteobacteria bacterium]|nr:hypothetical protein [Alphaproteobacteria bacterium]